MADEARDTEVNNRNSMTGDYERYERQIILPGIGVEGQQRLAHARVLIVGVGALGSVLASGIVRAGVGFVRLVDRDYLELHNLQRQTLFDEDDVTADLPKAIAAARKLARINSQVTIDPVVADVTHRNVEALLEDCDLVLDGSDNFEVRMLINEACLKHSKPWIYGGVIGTYGVTMPILPGGPCLRCLLPTVPAPGTQPTCDTAGILGTVPQVVAALQVTEALKLLTGHIDALCRELRYFDVWTGEVVNIDVSAATAQPCPVCQQGTYEWLAGQHANTADALCGRDAVQIHPRDDTETIDFGPLAERLAVLGEVTHNDFLLRFRKPPHEIVLFRNGRAIIHGVTDVQSARTLYARYIGH